RAVGEMVAYLGDLVARRRAEATGDLLSFLAHARPGGAPVPEEEIIAFAVLLMIAGNETTRNATSGGLVAFLEHPEQWERLRGALGEGGGAAPDEPGRPLRAHRDRGRAARRPEDPRRRRARALLRLGEPRRGGARGPLRVPRRPPAEPPPRLRRRRARLPRR